MIEAGSIGVKGENILTMAVLQGNTGPMQREVWPSYLLAPLSSYYLCRHSLLDRCEHRPGLVWSRYSMNMNGP